MCEPLRGKEKSFGICKLDGSSSLPFGFTKEDIKSAVEFYKKYRIFATNCMKEQPKCWSEWKKALKVKNGLYLDWTDWLFDYCFGDVIEHE